MGNGVRVGGGVRVGNGVRVGSGVRVRPQESSEGAGLARELNIAGLGCGLGDSTTGATGGGRTYGNVFRSDGGSSS